MADQNKVFAGFPVSLNDGYTQIPNAWFDILQQIDNFAESKIVLYIIRHTWGFQDKDGIREEMKKITTDEFAYGRKRRDSTRMDSGTGLALTSLKEGIKKAINHGYIICNVNDSDLGRIEKAYGLHILQEEESLDSQNLPISSQNSPMNSINLVTDNLENAYRSEKQTVETNLSKETDRNAFFYEKALSFLKEKERITFFDFEKYMHRFMRTRGEIDLQTNCKNVVFWTGWSSELCLVLLEMNKRKQIILKHCDKEEYSTKHHRPKLLITANMVECDQLHWFPSVIVYTDPSEYPETLQ